MTKKISKAAKPEPKPETKNKGGRPKRFSDPMELWDAFTQYVQHVKSRPIIVKDWVGGKGVQVYREKERPLTMEGFSLFCWERGICGDVWDYFTNAGGVYDQFSDIATRVKHQIRDDQISGGMAGIYNPSITARLNGLTEKMETKTEVTSITIKHDL
jgi:hypothetical protein